MPVPEPGTPGRGRRAGGWRHVMGSDSAENGSNAAVGLSISSVVRRTVAAKCCFDLRRQAFALRLQHRLERYTRQQIAIGLRHKCRVEI